MKGWYYVRSEIRIQEKGRVLRRLGQVTGTVRRKWRYYTNFMVMHKLETYISRHGLSSKFNINFENEEIKVRTIGSKGYITS